MGQKDRREKLFMACPDVFAELWNVLIFRGETVLSVDNLLPGPTETIYSGGRKLYSQLQDCSMYDMHDGLVQGFYTLENQSRQDLCMALRNAGYEGAAYRRQYRRKKEQGIYPVITLVLNWGEKPWKGAKSIRELLDYPVPQGAWEYLNDSMTHVFDMRFLEKSVRELFEGDMRIVLDYLCDRESLERRRQKMRNPTEVLLMLHALSGDDQYLEWSETIGERRELSMCDLLDEYWNRGIAQGINQGINQGISQGISQSIRNLMASMKLSVEQAMEALMIPKEEWSRYADMLK